MSAGRSPSASSTAALVEMHRRMLLIRGFEERVAALYRDGEVPGFVHLSIGQEAAAVGACWPLRRLDVAPVLDSVQRTGRLLIAHEAVVPFGIGAELAAVVAREGFWDLDAPIERIGAAATPPPYAPDLERAWLPDRADIAAAVRRLVDV